MVVVAIGVVDKFSFSLFLTIVLMAQHTKITAFPSLRTHLHTLARCIVTAWSVVLSNIVRSAFARLSSVLSSVARPYFALCPSFAKAWDGNGAKAAKRQFPTNLVGGGVNYENGVY